MCINIDMGCWTSLLDIVAHIGPCRGLQVVVDVDSIFTQGTGEFLSVRREEEARATACFNHGLTRDAR